jgi:mannose-6-phosphate isomerase-like protein (cupin superfamily)
MTAEETACRLFQGPLPAGYARRVFRVAPGLELGVQPSHLRDAIMVVAQGELELECRAGTCRRFGCGSMIPIGPMSIPHVRNPGPDPLVLLVISRNLTLGR